MSMLIDGGRAEAAHHPSAAGEPGNGLRQGRSSATKSGVVLAECTRIKQQHSLVACLCSLMLARLHGRSSPPPPPPAALPALQLVTAGMQSGQWGRKKAAAAVIADISKASGDALAPHAPALLDVLLKVRSSEGGRERRRWSSRNRWAPALHASSCTSRLPSLRPACQPSLLPVHPRTRPPAGASRALVGGEGGGPHSRGRGGRRLP